jgi:hypothetical protein
MAAAKGNDYCLKRTVNPQHTKEEIQKIITDLLEWAAHSDGIYLATYLYETYKKDKNWLHSLAQTHPEVNEAIEQAKTLIAGKIHNHCWIGDRNSSFGEKILPIYCKEYKEETERRAKINKIEESTDLKKVFDDFLTGIAKLTEKPSSKDPVESKVAAK